MQPPGRGGWMGEIRCGGTPTQTCLGQSLFHSIRRAERGDLQLQHPNPRRWTASREQGPRASLRAPAERNRSSRSRTHAGVVGGSAAALLGAKVWLRRRCRQQRSAKCTKSAPGVAMRSKLLADLLPPGVADGWSELELPVDGVEVVVCDLTDLDRCGDLVGDVFGVRPEDEEYKSTVQGLAERLGARRSVLLSAAPRPRLTRPIPLGSTERPDVGLVVAFQQEGGGPLVALNDISLWPSDGRVKAPGASSKPGVPSQPYMLNLCTSRDYLRMGLARALLAICERLVCEVWGDLTIFLHVEDNKAPANLLYEATGYYALAYKFDREFPYTKAEAKILRTVTWRKKTLAHLEEKRGSLTEKQKEVEDEYFRKLKEERGAELVPDDEFEGGVYSTGGEDGEDYSWVKQLIKE